VTNRICNAQPFRPTFLFVGASKSGSSWFFQILREHPQVFVPANKATFFFSDYYAKGLAWYDAFFVKAPLDSAIGEVCHDYMASPEALRRIRAYQPGMRLVCCLRNPYARALSSWRFFRRNGMDQPTLAAQGKHDPSVFDQGYYATQLSLLYSIFPKEQVLIFFFEEISATPKAVAHRLYEFIGVKPDFLAPSLHKRVNVNAKPRSRIVARLVQYIHRESWKHSHYLSNLIGQLKQIRPLRRFVRTTLYKETESSSDWREHIPEFPEEIVSRYESEIDNLESLLGKDLSRWRAKLTARSSQFGADSPARTFHPTLTPLDEG
jgi:sulfotransferase family protein